MPRKRRTYSPEFKAEAVRLVKSSSESTIAKELGVSDVALRHWVACVRPASVEPLTPDERSELKQLRRQVRRLREEREILKKATAFFAKHSE